MVMCVHVKKKHKAAALGFQMGPLSCFLYLVMVSSLACPHYVMLRSSLAGFVASWLGYKPSFSSPHLLLTTFSLSSTW